MSQTIVELFVKVIPVDLFRSGSKNNPNLHKIRTMPPRTIEQSFDIKIYNKNGVQFVSKDTGGISTFSAKKEGFGNFWWKIPRGTKIPSGLRVSRDFNPRPSESTHYTLRPLFDMPLTQFVSLLEELAKSAERTFNASISQSQRG